MQASAPSFPPNNAHMTAGPVGKDDASVSSDGSKGGGGLGSKDIGILAGAIGAGIALLGMPEYAQH